MSKFDNCKEALAPVKDALRGWAFSAPQLRRSKVAVARTHLPEVPEAYRAEAEQRIAAVEVHCCDD